MRQPFMQVSLGYLRRIKTCNAKDFSTVAVLVLVYFIVFFYTVFLLIGNMTRMDTRLVSEECMSRALMISACWVSVSSEGHTGGISEKKHRVILK